MWIYERFTGFDFDVLHTSIPPSTDVIFTENPFSKSVGGMVIRKGVAVSSFSWTPSPQSSVTVVDASDAIMIAGIVPSGMIRLQKKLMYTSA